MQKEAKVDRVIKIRVEYITFSVFVLFLLIAGLSIDSGITGFSIKEDENEWIVEFKTYEKADLVIEMSEGSGYSRRDDVEFLEMSCGNSAVIPNIMRDKIVYEGYDCAEKTKIRFAVNREGRFKQKISYGHNSRAVSFER